MYHFLIEIDITPLQSQNFPNPCPHRKTYAENVIMIIFPGHFQKHFLFPFSQKSRLICNLSWHDHCIAWIDQHISISNRLLEHFVEQGFQQSDCPIRKAFLIQLIDQSLHMIRPDFPKTHHPQNVLLTGRKRLTDPEQCSVFHLSFFIQF